MNPRVSSILVGAALALAPVGCAADRPLPAPTAENTRSWADLARTTTSLPSAERITAVPGAGYQGGGAVSTFCDHGNRVYVFDGVQRAGIAALPDLTCPRVG